MNRLEELELAHGVGPLAEIVKGLRFKYSDGGYYHLQMSDYIRTVIIDLGRVFKCEGCIKRGDAGMSYSCFKEAVRKAILEGTEIKFKSGEVWDFSRKEEDDVLR